MSTPGESTKHSRRPGVALLTLLREIGPFALVGLAGALVLLVVFSMLTEDVFAGEITAFDNNTAIWVHSFASPLLDTVFTDLSAFGGPVGMPLLMIVSFLVLIALRLPRNAWLVVIALLGGLVINQVLKLVFRRPRPDLWEMGSIHFGGFSFPSGHATLSFCLFGMLAWIGWNHIRSERARLAWVAFMALLVFLIGLSRIYLGAHFPSDVLAGYISAAFWLAALISGAEIYRRVRTARST